MSYCLHTHTHTHTHTHIQTDKDTRTHARTHTHTYRHIHTLTHSHTNTTHIRTHTHIHTHTHTHTYTHTHTHTYTYIHTHTHIYIHTMYTVIHRIAIQLPYSDNLNTSLLILQILKPQMHYHKAAHIFGSISSNYICICILYSKFINISFKSKLPKQYDSQNFILIVNSYHIVAS